MKPWTARAKGGIALILMVAAVVLIGRGLRQFVSYDSLWHVFIARQDSWEAFWQEVQHNAHPPLYYLLLKASLWLPGTPPLAYRTVSIVAVLVSTLLVAGIVRRITGNQALAVVAAAASGLSLNAIEIGLETRAYALGIAFMLVAFWAYLDWLGNPAAFVPTWKRAVFAGALTAALLTHYASFFFLAAALSAPIILACCHMRWRIRLVREIERRPIHFAFMFGIPAVAAALEYVVHTRSAVARNGHVRDFLYDHARESMPAFVARTTNRLAHLFSPDLGWDATVVEAVMVGAFVVMGWLVARRTFRGRLITVPLVFAAVMWLLNIAAALMARYPYGGELRHEIHLFAFMLLALFCTIECAARTLRSSRISRLAWVTAAGVAVAANFALWISTSAVTTERLMQPQMDHFRGLIGSPPAVLVDQYNLIMLFGHHDTAEWRLVWQDRRSNPWQVWSVISHGGQRFAVCRSKQWQIDLSSPAAYAQAADCLDLTRAERVAVFRPQQYGLGPLWDTKAARSFATELAPKAGLLTEAIEVLGDDVYASFTLLAFSADDRRIAVTEATYGGNCGGPLSNATIPLRTACDGQRSCTFRVEVPALGDPAPGCAKDFRVQWTCESGKALRRAAIDPEAGLGSLVLLSCLR